MHFLAATFTSLVPPNNDSTIIRISNIPLPYLFISICLVYILSGILTLLAISSLLITYQLHHKNNHEGFTSKLVAISGSPFTLTGATSMSAGQLWANKATAPSGETIDSLLNAQESILSMKNTHFHSSIKAGDDAAFGTVYICTGLVRKSSVTFLIRWHSFSYTKGPFIGSTGWTLLLKSCDVTMTTGL